MRHVIQQSLGEGSMWPAKLRGVYRQRGQITATEKTTYQFTPGFLLIKTVVVTAKLPMNVFDICELSFLQTPIVSFLYALLFCKLFLAIKYFVHFGQHPRDALRTVDASPCPAPKLKT